MGEKEEQMRERMREKESEMERLVLDRFIENNPIVPTDKTRQTPYGSPLLSQFQSL